MYISNFSISNYKCFQETDIIEFNSGINIIVGKNNSGKTALIERLNLNFKNLPHSSIKTLPDRYTTLINTNSSAEITLSFTHQEFYRFLEQIPKPLGIPILISNSYREAKEEGIADPKDLHIMKIEESFEKFKDFLAKDDKLINLSLSISDNSKLLENGKGSKRFNFDIYNPEYTYNYQTGKGYYLFAKIEKHSHDNAIELILVNEREYDNGESYEVFSHYDRFVGDYTKSIAYKIFDLYKTRIYRFYAERPQAGTCPYGDSDELKPDASNLAEVLNYLQSNPTRFKKFNDFVNLIFPQIKWISVIPNNGKFKILVWNIYPSTERSDLALSLESCGTGISQVLAILYIVVTSQDSRTIIIDEPQSFLHPGATKDLIEILKEFPQHQYFITTHSPAIIAVAEPSNIIQLKYDEKEYKTVISVIDSQRTQDMYSLLSEIGVQLSDIFGADRILWVEGETEEICFPLILKKIAKQKLRGTQILRVHSTGTLVDTKKDKLSEAFFWLYQKVSNKESLFPPAIGFVFDKEGKTKEQCIELEKRSENCRYMEKLKHKPITWLTRTMYENYILHPEALVYVINKELQTATVSRDVNELPRESITTEKLEMWLRDKINKEFQSNNKRYFPNGVKKEKNNNQEWIYQEIHASHILETLFNDYKIEFRKTKHSPEITKWILENDKVYLSELINIIEGVFKQT
ncbi:AAA family ATPase [Nostoc sp. LEGE 12447]|uniref:AAA family ATPase n=1 Tax=Nostoc sp. LEGE 12447 TaxID=1828640 RepID=UPI0018819DB6|nr:AAA family ATPase [Nostoc sp. LEGE 12447]MBE8996740.1 AAA family ATPase [Nostoc sp. LEGE 12447]